MSYLVPNVVTLQVAGVPVVNGKIHSYYAGTLTPLSVLDGPNGSALPNPVRTDENGQAVMWLRNESYKLTFTDENDVTVAETIDGIRGDVLYKTSTFYDDGADALYAPIANPIPFAVLGGAVNEYVFDPAIDMGEYTKGQEFIAEVNITNTGASTMQIGSQAARDIKRVGGAALIAGDLTEGRIPRFIVGDSTIILQNALTTGDATTENPLSQFAATTSAQLAATLSDETGYSSGALAVFSKNPTVDSITNTGNLTFTGTSNRITGDFSNATFANRTCFQNSVANGDSRILALPNGTGKGSSWQAWTGSSTTDCYRAFMQCYDDSGGGTQFAEFSMEAVGSPTTPTTTMKMRWSMYGQSILESIYDGSSYYMSLIQGRLKFPASQNASTDPNTLDDYEEDDTATLAVSCATPGDLAISASTLAIRKTKIGRLVNLEFNFTFTPTFTTASGKLIVTGLEDSRTAGNVSTDGTVGVFSNITKAGYTHVGCRILSGSPTTLEFTASGSGVAIDNINMANLTSGVATTLRGQISYCA